MEDNKQYWTARYASKQTGWNIGYPSTPIKEYVDQLEDKSIKILLPGAGNGYEAEYLFEQGFINTHVLDISEIPLKNFAQRVPTFPKNQLLQADFFEIEGVFDLILEQTFFCSFPPSKRNRTNYAKKTAELLSDGGKLAGLWFDHQLDHDGQRPFGGSEEEYIQYFEPHFELIQFERCYNSIPPRSGKELFGILKK